MARNRSWAKWERESWRSLCCHRDSIVFLTETLEAVWRWHTVDFRFYKTRLQDIQFSAWNEFVSQARPFENSANFVRGNLFLTFSFTAQQFVSNVPESHLFSVATSIKFKILNENNFNHVLIAKYSLCLKKDTFHNNIALVQVLENKGSSHRWGPCEALQKLSPTYVLWVDFLLRKFSPLLAVLGTFWYYSCQCRNYSSSGLDFIFKQSARGCSNFN